MLLLNVSLYYSLGKLQGEVVSSAWFGKLDVSHKERLPPLGVFPSVKLGDSKITFFLRVCSPSMEKGAVRAFRSLLPPLFYLRAAFFWFGVH